MFCRKPCSHGLPSYGLGYGLCSYDRSHTSPESTFCWLCRFFFRPAIQKQRFAAMCNLASLIERGEGTPPDPQRARDLLSQAGVFVRRHDFVLCPFRVGLLPPSHPARPP